MSERADGLGEAVLETFRNTVDVLQSELEVMPLDRWTESVFRYFFCRFLATQHPDIEQFPECGKIDLVLQRSVARAFIEFKFYRHAPRYDPYNGRQRGFKGGPGGKNLGEFEACVELLHERPSSPTLSKYIVLSYGDPADETRPSLRYARQYDEYRHSREGVGLRLLESRGPFTAGNAVVRAQLYEVGAA